MSITEDLVELGLKAFAGGYLIVAIVFMFFDFWVSFALLAIMIAFLISCFHLVNHNEAIVVERLGKFDQVLREGLHFIFAPLKNVRQFNMGFNNSESGPVVFAKGCALPTAIRRYDPLPYDCTTASNSKVSLNVVVKFKIGSVERVAYAHSPLLTLQDTVKDNVISTVRQMTPEQLSRGNIEEVLNLEKINKKLEESGFVVTDVEVQTITWPVEAQKDMEKLQKERTRMLAQAETTRLALEAQENQMKARVKEQENKTKLANLELKAQADLERQKIALECEIAEGRSKQQQIKFQLYIDHPELIPVLLMEQEAKRAESMASCGAGKKIVIMDGNLKNSALNSLLFGAVSAATGTKEASSEN